MSNVYSGVTYPGEVLIDEVSIITTKGIIQTVTNQVLSIEIYQDMFTPLMHGVLNLREAHDFANLFPLVGEEILRVHIITPGFKEEYAIKGEFYIYKMDSKLRAADRESFYSLHFISKEALVDLNKKISRTYEGKISDIVTKLIREDNALETNKPITIEPTYNKTKYTSNFWSPLKNINYLMENAVNDNGSPSYVFFENQFGINFVSLESLYQVPVYQSFVMDNYSADVPKTGSSYRDLDKDYQRVLELHTDESFDYMKRIRSGMYGSRYQYYDLTTKQYVDKIYNPLDDFPKDKHLNPNSLISDTAIFRPSSLTFRDSKDYGNFNKYGDVTNVDITPHRISLLQQLNANKVVISVFGRTDYAVGQVMNLTAYKIRQLNQTDDPNEYIDEIISGNYIVTALNHFITRKKHDCSIELMKESLLKDLNK